MDTIPPWRLVGDWFDVCNCDIPCPCEFAQAPTGNACQGVLAYHINEGHYGDVRLDGLNVMELDAFEGNIWAGEAQVTLGQFLDERADERQRQALQMIFGGRAGGWPGDSRTSSGSIGGSSSRPSSSRSPMTSPSGGWKSRARSWPEPRP